MTMSCDFDRIDALLDGSLPEAERASVLAHMNTCSACRAYYEVMAGLEGDETVPVGFSQRVMERVRATPQKAARRIPYGKILSAVAACAVLVVSLQLLPSLGFGTADESAESNVLFPALGKPTRPTSASTFNSRMKAPSSPSSPGCA